MWSLFKGIWVMGSGVGGPVFNRHLRRALEGLWSTWRQQLEVTQSQMLQFTLENSAFPCQTVWEALMFQAIRQLH